MYALNSTVTAWFGVSNKTVFETPGIDVDVAAKPTGRTHREQSFSLCCVVFGPQLLMSSDLCGNMGVDKAPTATGWRGVVSFGSQSN